MSLLCLYHQVMRITISHFQCGRHTLWYWSGHVILQVCKLLRHVAPTETLQIASKYSEINLRLYGPQLLAAAHIVCLHPNSKIAKENFEGEYCTKRRAMDTWKLVELIFGVTGFHGLGLWTTLYGCMHGIAHIDTLLFVIQLTMYVWSTYLCKYRIV